jgi:hypothetical protein
MVVAAALARAIGSTLQTVADGLLWLADVLTANAKLILAASRICLDRAREWDPRLWERDHDAGTDTRERQP